ncbi:hypothetical protein Tco_0200704 [Tanacetum coccineum]
MDIRLQNLGSYGGVKSQAINGFVDTIFSTSDHGMCIRRGNSGANMSLRANGLSHGCKGYRGWSKSQMDLVQGMLGLGGSV